MPGKYRLYSKKDAMEVYRIPVHEMSKALESGEIISLFGHDGWGRRYIPGISIEQWLEDKVSEAKASNIDIKGESMIVTQEGDKEWNKKWVVSGSNGHESADSSLAKALYDVAKSIHREEGE